MPMLLRKRKHRRNSIIRGCDNKLRLRPPRQCNGIRKLRCPAPTQPQYSRVGAQAKKGPDSAAPPAYRGVLGLPRTSTLAVWPI